MDLPDSFTKGASRTENEGQKEKHVSSSDAVSSVVEKVHSMRAKNSSDFVKESGCSREARSCRSSVAEMSFSDSEATHCDVAPKKPCSDDVNNAHSTKEHNSHGD